MAIDKFMHVLLCSQTAAQQKLAAFAGFGGELLSQIHPLAKGLENVRLHHRAPRTRLPVQPDRVVADDV